MLQKDMGGWELEGCGVWCGAAGGPILPPNRAEDCVIGENANLGNEFSYSDRCLATTCASATIATRVYKPRLKVNEECMKYADFGRKPTVNANPKPHFVE